MFDFVEWEMIRTTFQWVHWRHTFIIKNKTVYQSFVIDSKLDSFKEIVSTTSYVKGVSLTWFIIKKMMESCLSKTLKVDHQILNHQHIGQPKHWKKIEHIKTTRKKKIRWADGKVFMVIRIRQVLEKFGGGWESDFKDCLQ
jgi:hypothetical protein